MYGYDFPFLYEVKILGKKSTPQASGMDPYSSPYKTDYRRFHFCPGFWLDLGILIYLLHTLYVPSRVPRILLKGEGNPKPQTLKFGM